MKRLSIYLINQYQKFSKQQNKCRLTPTCSNFAKTAIIRFGFIKGITLSLKRLLICNFTKSSTYNPVPQNIKGDFKWLI